MMQRKYTLLLFFTVQFISQVTLADNICVEDKSDQRSRMEKFFEDELTMIESVILTKNFQIFVTGSNDNLMIGGFIYEKDCWRFLENNGPPKNIFLESSISDKKKLQKEISKIINENIISYQATPEEKAFNLYKMLVQDANKEPVGINFLQYNKSPIPNNGDFLEYEFVGTNLADFTSCKFNFQTIGDAFSCTILINEAMEIFEMSIKIKENRIGYDFLFSIDDEIKYRASLPNLGKDEQIVELKSKNDNEIFKSMKFIKHQKATTQKFDWKMISDMKVVKFDFCWEQFGNISSGYIEHAFVAVTLETYSAYIRIIYLDFSASGIKITEGRKLSEGYSACYRNISNRKEYKGKAYTDLKELAPKESLKFTDVLKLVTSWNTPYYWGYGNCMDFTNHIKEMLQNKLYLPEVLLDSIPHKMGKTNNTGKYYGQCLNYFKSIFKNFSVKKD
jgi:hypothetical protein